MSRLESLMDALLHDLKGHLQGLVGVAGLLAEVEAANLSPDGQDWAARIQTSGEAAAALLEGAQRLARLDARPIESLPCDLGQLAQTAAAAVAADSPRQPSIHVAAGLPTVLGAPAELGWALRELIDNAVRFGDSDTPSVHVEWTDDGALAVRDDGPGIAEGLIEQAIDPFEHDRDHPAAGVGIGLTVAAWVAARHGGLLVLSSPDGGGLVAGIEGLSLAAAPVEL